MILYLSLGGSGNSDTLEKALLAAVDAETDLRFVAVVDDQQFGDVDAATMEMLGEELEFLLRAQLVAVKRRLAAPPDGSVEVHRGAAVDAVSDRRQDLDEVLIGGPLILSAAEATMLVAELGQRSGVAASVING